MVRLNTASLPTLPSQVARPAYDRSRVQNGIVHIGVGGFHRAHEAVYVDDLLGQGDTQWGIYGVGLLPRDQKMKEALVAQDCLYTVLERSAAGDTARVVGSLTRYLLAPEDPEAVLHALASPTTRIVSLTITEGGYNFDQGTGEFIADDPHIAHDLAHPGSPVSVFGYVTEALYRRHRSGIAPFTLLSCDNLPQNGAVARKMFLAYAALRAPSLATWITQNVSFPNSMVDRITPQTTDADRQRVRDEFGIDDGWPVVCEPFRQWIIEDRFCNGRPALESVGAQFTADVHPYESMKIRLLNASHSAMGYLGCLAGYRLIPEVMADPLFHAYIAALMDDEITPLLAPVPGIDIAGYKRTLLLRFANPAIADQVQRICLDGSSKMPKFLLPSIRDAMAQNRPISKLVLAVAGWFRYLMGTDEQGNPIEIDDPLASELQARARQGGTDPRPLLGLRRVFGDLGDNQPFVALLAAALESLSIVGAREAVRQAMHA
jgi:mannitol 2-dehydrogenase